MKNNVFKDIFDYRQMVFGLVHRELRGRYKGSVLGFLWTFLNPLLQLLVYTLLFGVLLKSNINDFYLYLFVGLIPWIFIQTSAAGGSGAVLNQKSLVTKIRFPREVLPISYVTTAFINMLYCFIIIFVVVGINVTIHSVQAGFLAGPNIISGVNQQPYNFLPFLSLPLLFIIEYVFALGLCFLTSSITVYFRDMEHILSIVTMFWCYCTPIMYSLDNILAGDRQKYKWIFIYFNPMTSIVQGFQNVLYYGTWPDFSTLWVGAVYAIVFLLIGFFTFEGLKKRFAEEL